MSLAKFFSLLMRLLRPLFLALLYSSSIWALSDTDTITWGGDNTRTGYQTKHNLDPKVVTSTDFDQIFKTLLPGNFQGLSVEQIYASPLVYTGDDGIQHVYVATTQNNIYKLDAKTGAIIQSRNLHVPFLQADLESCVDINPLIGITATGVIDLETGIWYVTAKTYAPPFQDGNFSPNNPPGRLNGRMYQHAIHTSDLSEVEGWPILVDGTIFRNNPNRMFIGGDQHSRPGALLVGDFLYTGYASHCVQYNYTGAIIGFDKTTRKIIEAFATEGGPEPNTVRGGGIWMSGGGIASDGKGSIYFATGNGYASQLKPSGNSLPGRNPPTALEEAAVHAKINDDGTLSIIDFFIPEEKVSLDGGDKDLGTTALQILPSDTFSCPNHRRIGVVTGKSGKTYWLNLDDLGGYQMGSGSGDAVIQVFQNENSVYASAGVLPLGGGYVYVSVTQYQTHVFKFSCNDAGSAVFTKVADTEEKNAYILGTGHGTTTSLEGEEGTGLLWITDVNGLGLRIYDPIPPTDGGALRLLRNFKVPGVTKFSRPVFGDERVYVGTHQGYIYGFGTNANASLNCSSPLDFGAVEVGNVSSPLTITCTSLTDTSLTGIQLADTKDYNTSDSLSLPLSLVTGQSFNFTAVCHPSTVGPLSTDVSLNLTNAHAGFSSTVKVNLKAVGHSSAPALRVSPDTINFTNVVVGQSSPPQTSLFQSLGDTVLTVSDFNFSLVSPDGPWVPPNTTLDGHLEVGDFVFLEVPDTIQPNTSASMSVIYTPGSPGNDTIYIKAISDGGNAGLRISGSAGTQPKAVIEFQTADGEDWVPFSNSTAYTFGAVFESQTRNLLMRITNGGGPNAIPLGITVSKPPYGIPGIIGASNAIDLAEGTTIPANHSQTANLYCSVPKSQINVPAYNGTAVWTLNTGDPTLGKQEIQFLCEAISQQAGPVFDNGTARYGYVGCFQEGTTGRQLAELAYSDTQNNTNGRCVEACNALNYTFAGTEYRQECWCGNAIPLHKDSDGNCNLECSGDAGQICGGDGILHDTAHISLFADSTRFDGNTTAPPLELPRVVGGYGFVGCFAETAGKTVSDKSMTSNSLTVQACAAFCEGEMYFGVEYESECYCGTTLNSKSTKTYEKECGMSCKGSNSQFCGGASRMQVYQRNGTAPGSSSTISGTPTTSLSPTGHPSASLDTSISAPTSSSPPSSPAPTSLVSTIPFSLTSTAAAPTSTPTLACPASNGTTYTSSSGVKYLIQCSMDHAGGDIPPGVAYVATLEACITLCDSTAGCVDVSFVLAGGGACYPKNIVGEAVADERVSGAKRI